jgi:hypothetical protein
LTTPTLSVAHTCFRPERARSASHCQRTPNPGPPPSRRAKPADEYSVPRCRRLRRTMLASTGFAILLLGSCARPVARPVDNEEVRNFLASASPNGSSGVLMRRGTDLGKDRVDRTIIELYVVQPDESGSPQWKLSRTFQHDAFSYACWDREKSVLWVATSGVLNAFERVGNTWEVTVTDVGAPACAQRVLKKSGPKPSSPALVHDCREPASCGPSVNSNGVSLGNA